MIEIPAKSKKEDGVVIVLHGWGANKHDLVPLVETLNLPNLRFIFLEGQIDVPGTGGTGKGWFIFPPTNEFKEERQKSRKQITSVIENLCKDGIDVGKIVLMGFSQGAAMSFDVALNFSCDGQSVGAIISMSGFFMDAEEAKKKTGMPTNIPILAAHGTFDPLIPLNRGKNSVMVLKSVGFNIEWHEYPMAHQVVMDELQDIRQFLLRVFQSANE